MDLITKSSSEYKEMSLDETLKFLETSYVVDCQGKNQWSVLIVNQ